MFDQGFDLCRRRVTVNTGDSCEHGRTETDCGCSNKGLTCATAWWNDRELVVRCESTDRAVQGACSARQATSKRDWPF